MRRIFLVLVLVLVLFSAGIADELKVNPKFYWSTAPLVVFNPRYDRWGLTVLGFDGSLLQIGKFRFPSVGLGLQMYQKRVLGWHQYYDYYGYPQQYYGYGYRFFFRPYLKITPVKYHWDWMSELLNINSYVEVGLALNPFKAEKDYSIAVGITFSGNPFKKKPKEEGEIEEQLKSKRA